MYAYNVVVIYDMGVSVILCGFAMGGPSCVADTACALKSTAGVSLLGKNLKPALCLYDYRICFSVPDRETCRVVTSVFKLGKTVQKDGSCLFLACVTDYSAHIKNISLI